MVTRGAGGAGGRGDEEFVEPVTVLWRRKWIVLPIIIVLTLATALITPTLPKSYTAKAALIFPQRPEASGLLGAFGALSGALGPIGGLGGGPTLSQDTVTVILRSRHIAYQIIDANDLVRHYGSADKQAAAVTLARNTTVRHTREGSVEIEVTDSEPKRAAAIVNSYVDLLKQFTAQNVNLFLQRQKALYLKDALATTTGELKRAEDALAAFSTENKVISIDAEAQMLVQTLGEFEKQLGVTEAEADYAAAMLAAMRSALARIAASSPLAPPAHSPYLQKLRSDLVELNYELAMALKDRTEEDPWVKRLRASIDETMIQARAELEHIGAAAKEGTAPEVIDLAAIDLGEKAKVEALQAARNDLLAQMKDVPQTALEYLRLKREVEVREKVYEALSVEYEQARVGQMVEEEPFVVLDRGEAPTRHSKPRLRVNVAIAFVLSTVIGMLVALAVEGRSVRRR